jgi:hypothetical protein
MSPHSTKNAVRGQFCLSRGAFEAAGGQNFAPIRAFEAADGRKTYDNSVSEASSGLRGPATQCFDCRWRPAALCLSPLRGPRREKQPCDHPPQRPPTAFSPICHSSLEAPGGPRGSRTQPLPPPLEASSRPKALS